MTPTQNQAVLTWIDEMAARTRPASIVWIDGSEEQLEALRAQAVREGILTKLNQEKLPGCYLHRTDRLRRGPGGGPHLHLLPEGKRMPDPPTTGWLPRRCMPSCTSFVRGFHGGARHVCHPLLHGRGGFPLRQVRH